MTEILVCCLILAVIIIFILCYEFKIFKRKIEGDKNIASAFYKEVNKKIVTDFAKYRDLIEPFADRIDPDNRLSLIVVEDCTSSNASKAEEVYNRNFNNIMMYLSIVATYVTRQSLTKIENLERKIDSLVRNNDLLCAEAKASRLLENMVNADIKSKKNISIELKRILDILRSDERDSTSVDTVKFCIDDLESQISKESLELNEAEESLAKIHKVLRSIDHILKDESDCVDGDWKQYISASKLILESSLAAMQISYEKKEHIEVCNIFSKVRAIVEQINLTYLELCHNLYRHNKSKSSTVLIGGSLC